MQIQAAPGGASQVTQSLPANGLQPVLMDNVGALAASEFAPRYYLPTYRKMLFGGSNQAVVATAMSAGLVTAYTGGLVLANPYGSGWNLVLTKVGFAFILGQTNAALIGLMVGQSATALGGTLTSVNPRSKNIGSGAIPVGQLYSSASITLPVAPTLDTILGFVDTGAITTQEFGGPTLFDLEGSIILPPGAYCAFYSSAAGTASSFFGSMTWGEFPI